jgi:hypothetical protein
MGMAIKFDGFNDSRFGKATSAGGQFSDSLSSFYRKWFIQGQADYRAGNAMPGECEFDEASIEAWNMGWQCDAAVEERGLKLSDLGVITPPPSALEMAVGQVSYDTDI